MKKILTGLILIMGMNATAQVAYSTTKDEKTGDLVFNGPVTFAALNKEPSFPWLTEGEKGYKPDERVMEYVRYYIKDYSIVVFLGTWCEDSHYLVPKLEKVLEQSAYPLDKVTMYGVDREKATKGGEHIKYKVTLVPTIILFKDNKEAGRITESVETTVERTLAAIIEKDLKK